MKHVYGVSRELLGKQLSFKPSVFGKGWKYDVSVDGYFALGDVGKKMASELAENLDWLHPVRAMIVDFEQKKCVVCLGNLDEQVEYWMKHKDAFKFSEGFVERNPQYEGKVSVEAF